MYGYVFIFRVLIKYYIFCVYIYILTYFFLCVIFIYLEMHMQTDDKLFLFYTHVYR